MDGIKRTYYITEQLEDKIRRVAYKEKTTMSEIVRRAIKQFKPETYIDVYGIDGKIHSVPNDIEF